MRTPIVTALFILMLLSALDTRASSLAAQTRHRAEDASATDAAYRACLPENAAGGSSSAMKAAADDAERRARDLIREDRQALDARVSLAQVLLRCQLPHAGPTRIMGLIEEAERELRGVLSLEPDHWSARFLLALTLHNMPAMLGRADDARQELERLVAQQGTRGGPPHEALPFVHLGDHHFNSGRLVLAVETWRRGLAVHPDSPLLIERLERAGVAAEPDSAWLTAGSDSIARIPESADGMPVYALAPLRIEASNHQFNGTRSGTTLRRLDVYTMPGGTGEMLQALQAMPGATRAGDGAELYIRGGDPAETPVFLDGGRLAFPGRWESLHGSAMGVVDASVLRRVYFSSGGFSARYGNALSGVVDVETEGRPTRRAYRFGANMVQAGASLRAPLGVRTGTWATLTATDTRLVTAMNGEADLYSRAPQSVQAIGGFTYMPAAGMEVRASALSLGDRFTRRVSMNGHDGDLDSGSTMQHVALSGRALRPDGRRGATVSATVSRRSSALRLGVLDRERDDLAVGTRIDTDAFVHRRTRVRAGAELIRYSATTTGRVPTSPSLAPGSPAAALPGATDATVHAGAYVEAEHEPVPGLAIAVGMRTDRLPGQREVTVDPRAAASHTAGEWTLRVGGGVFRQGSWRAGYRLPDPGQPAGVPLRAQHLVAGLERGGALSFRVEGYVKTYSDFVPWGEGRQAEAGTNTGFDAMMRWAPRYGPSGWLAYSLLRSRVELAGGDVVPSALDVTHSLTGVARMPLGRTWELGITARYATGKPFTPIVGSADGMGLGAGPVYGEIHEERLPQHRRVDARLTRYLIGSGRTAVAYLEMLNVLDRRNVMSYTYGDDFTTRVPVNAFFAHRSFVLGVELQFN